MISPEVWLPPYTQFKQPFSLKNIFTSWPLKYNPDPRPCLILYYPKILNKGRTSNKMGAPLFSTSDGIISKTVCPIYLKIDVLIVHIGHS